MFALNINPLTKLLAVAAMFTAFTSFAGTKDGGGGGAYVCRNADGSIRKSMLADLWEAKNTPFRWPHKTGKISIPNSGESRHVLLQRALDRLEKLNPSLARQVSDEGYSIWKNLEMVPEDVSIAVPDDLKVGYFPTGCPAEGMMFYNDEADQLHVRSDLLRSLETETDQAAAWMHEALYKILREQGGHADSRKTRRLVACLFSDEPDCLALPKQEVVPNDGRFIVECISPSFKVTYFPEIRVLDPADLDKSGSRVKLIWQKIGNLDLGYLPVATMATKNVSPWNREPYNPYEVNFKDFSPTKAYDFYVHVGISGLKEPIGQEKGYLLVFGYNPFGSLNTIKRQEHLECSRIR